MWPKRPPLYVLVKLWLTWHVFALHRPPFNATITLQWPLHQSDVCLDKASPKHNSWSLRWEKLDLWWSDDQHTGFTIKKTYSVTCNLVHAISPLNPRCRTRKRLATLNGANPCLDTRWNPKRKNLICEQPLRVKTKSNIVWKVKENWLGHSYFWFRTSMQTILKWFRFLQRPGLEVDCSTDKLLLQQRSLFTAAYWTTFSL